MLEKKNEADYALEQPKKKKGVGKYIVIALVVIIAIALFSGGGDDEATPTASNSEPKQEQKIEYEAHTASDLIATLDENALVAEDYEGKYLEITGKLGTIDSDGKYFCLDGEDFSMYNVQIDIQNAEQLATLKTFKKDDKLVIRCKITDVGEVWGYFADLIEFVE